MPQTLLSSSQYRQTVFGATAAKCSYHLPMKCPFGWPFLSKLLARASHNGLQPSPLLLQLSLSLKLSVDTFCPNTGLTRYRYSCLKCSLHRRYHDAVRNHSTTIISVRWLVALPTYRAGLATISLAHFYQFDSVPSELIPQLLHDPTITPLI